MPCARFLGLPFGGFFARAGFVAQWSQDESFRRQVTEHRSKMPVVCHLPLSASSTTCHLSSVPFSYLSPVICLSPVNCHLSPSPFNSYLAFLCSSGAQGLPGLSAGHLLGPEQCQPRGGVFLVSGSRELFFLHRFRFSRLYRFYRLRRTLASV